MMAKKEKKTSDKSVFREYFELIAETAVFVFFVMTFVVQAFQIPTGSMEPTLLVGDFLLVNKLVYTKPVLPLEGARPARARRSERQDIVVFKYPNELNKDFVKRVIGLRRREDRDPGQAGLRQRPAARRALQGPQRQPGLSKNDYYHYDDLIRDNYGPVVVPPGHRLRHGRQPGQQRRQPLLGLPAPGQHQGPAMGDLFLLPRRAGRLAEDGVSRPATKFVSFLPKARWGRMLKIIH